MSLGSKHRLVVRSLVALSLAFLQAGGFHAQQGSSVPPLVGDSTLLPVPGFDDPGGRWVEQSSLLGKLRWQVDRLALQVLQPLMKSTSSARITTKVNLRLASQIDHGLTRLEQQALVITKEDYLLDALRPLGSVQLEVTSDIIEAWRPNVLLNLLLVALPGPSAALMTRGGVRVQTRAKDRLTGVVVAALDCRESASVTAFFGAFGRVSHAESALKNCADTFAALLQNGTLSPPTSAQKDAEYNSQQSLPGE
jgi:hypothetical protein